MLRSSSSNCSFFFLCMKIVPVSGVQMQGLGTLPFRGTEHPHRSLMLGGMREMLTCTVAFTFTTSSQEIKKAILNLKKNVRLEKLE